MTDYINYILFDDDRFNTITEYVSICDKIMNIIAGKRQSIKGDISKIKKLHWDALLIFIKLEVSLTIILSDLERQEDYETCCIVRDLLIIIQNELQ